MSLLERVCARYELSTVPVLTLELPAAVAQGHHGRRSTSLWLVDVATAVATFLAVHGRLLGAI